jgi:hypothetical protein
MLSSCRTMLSEMFAALVPLRRPGLGGGGSLGGWGPKVCLSSQDLLLLVLDLSGIEERKVVRKEHLRGSCLQRHPLQLELRERYWWHLSKRDLLSWQFVQA